MSIQKIMNVSSRKIKPSLVQTKNSGCANKSTNNKILNNEYLNEIPFKGHSKTITVYNGKVDPNDYYGTSGQRAHVDKKDVPVPEGAFIRQLNDKNNGDFHSASVEVYYADKYEEVDYQRLAGSYTFVVAYDEIPPAVSEETINNASKPADIWGVVKEIEKRGRMIDVKIQEFKEKKRIADGDYRDATYQIWDAREDRDIEYWDYQINCNFKKSREMAEQINALENDKEENSKKLELAQSKLEKVGKSPIGILSKITGSWNRYKAKKS